QHLSMRNPARSDDHVLVLDDRLQGVVEILGLNSTGLEVDAILMAGQVAIASQELFAPPDGLFERKILETMERVVVHESPHRPVLRDDFACEVDDPSQLHPSRFDVGPVLYLFHGNDPVMALLAVTIVSDPKKVAGISPNASNTTTSMASDANSLGSRSV